MDLAYLAKPAGEQHEQEMRFAAEAEPQGF